MWERPKPKESLQIYFRSVLLPLRRHRVLNTADILDTSIANSNDAELVEDPEEAIRYFLRVFR